MYGKGRPGQGHLWMPSPASHFAIVVPRRQMYDARCTPTPAAAASPRPGRRMAYDRYFRLRHDARYEEAREIYRIATAPARSPSPIFPPCLSLMYNRINNSKNDWSSATHAIAIFAGPSGSIYIFYWRVFHARGARRALPARLPAYQVQRHTDIARHASPTSTATRHHHPQLSPSGHYRHRSSVIARPRPCEARCTYTQKIHKKIIDQKEEETSIYHGLRMYAATAACGRHGARRAALARPARITTLLICCYLPFHA